MVLGPEIGQVGIFSKLNKLFSYLDLIRIFTGTISMKTEFPPNIVTTMKVQKAVFVSPSITDTSITAWLSRRMEVFRIRM